MPPFTHANQHYLQLPLEMFNTAILGCVRLSKHEGLKIVLAATHVTSLINTLQLHSKMWMTLSGGGEYVTCDILFFLTCTDFSRSITQFNTRLSLEWPMTTWLSRARLYHLNGPSLVVASWLQLVRIGSQVTFLKPFKF